MSAEKQTSSYSPLNRHRLRLIFAGLTILLLIFFLLDLFLGSVTIKPADIVRAIFNDTGDITETILIHFRLPKAITSLLVGMALSISGLQMQTLFRNPMAGPYVLGLSSGASLGVAFVILGFSSNLAPDSIRGIGNWAIAAASWAGAGSVMILVMVISSRVKNIMTVLILGIMLASGISAVVSIMQYFSNETMLKTYIIWTMGSLGNLTSSQLNVMLVSVSAGTHSKLNLSKDAQCIAFRGGVCQKHRSQHPTVAHYYYGRNKYPGRYYHGILRTNRIYWHCSASSCQNFVQDIRS